ncbi:hypothetical protein HYDPIDRAFT_104988 [Hydnomerulius pinastri MD-312]|nr:hypothetical protein HYDPIDRAFT_104988 [Hydnomerulius pinastri MD-312]
MNNGCSHFHLLVQLIYAGVISGSAGGGRFGAARCPIRAERSAVCCEPLSYPR